MKRNLIIVAALLLFIGCTKQKKEYVSKEKFTDEVRLKTTPVKNQGKSSLCWAYAMLATIETEQNKKGDSINLSTDYVARMYLLEQAKRKLMSQKRKTLLGGNDTPITTRGMSGMLIDLIQTYGLQHYDAYHQRKNTNYNVIARKLNQAVMAPKSAHIGTEINHLNEFLDAEIGYIPNHVFLYGAVYTPQEFARSVCRNDEYLAITSFLHHPFGEYFPLEVPDNYFHNTFLNVPIEEMITKMERTVRAGHPICWEGDISEDGFSYANGFARIENESMKPTQEQRQKAFETFKTTDDHCMEIVGIAHDKQGNKYFCCKNSWGRTNRFGGFMYLSYNYVRLKTIAIYVPQK